MIDHVPSVVWVPGVGCRLDWKPTPGVFLQVRGDREGIVFRGDPFGIAPLYWVAVPGRVVASPHPLNVARLLTRCALGPRHATQRKAGKVLTIDAQARLDERDDDCELPLPFPFATPFEFLVETYRAALARYARLLPPNTAFLLDGALDTLLPLLAAADAGKNPIAVVLGELDPRSTLAAVLRERAISLRCVPFARANDLEGAIAFAAIHTGLHDRFALDELVEASVLFHELVRDGIATLVDSAAWRYPLGVTLWQTACVPAFRGVYWERMLWYRSKYLLLVQNARALGARLLLASACGLDLRFFATEPPFVWFFLRCPPSATGTEPRHSALAREAASAFLAPLALRFLVRHEKPLPRVGPVVRKIGVNVIHALGDGAILRWKEKMYRETRAVNEFFP